MTSPITETLTAPAPGDSAGADFALARGVVLAVVDDGSSRLLNLGGTFFGLPPASTDLLLSILHQGSNRAAATIAARYGVAEDRVQDDLSKFLTDLIRRGLLVPGMHRGQSLLRRATDATLVRSLQTARLALRLFGSREWCILTLAVLSIRLFGWGRATDIWEQLTPIRLPSGDSVPTPLEVERIDHAIRAVAAAHPAIAECKERALACWALLRERGLAARLVVGVDLYPFLGHCWCEWDGRVVSDDAARCYRFVPVWSLC